MDASRMEKIALGAYSVSVQESGWPQLLGELRTLLNARSALIFSPDIDSARMMLGPPDFTREHRDKLVAMPNPWLDRLRALRLPRPTGSCRIGSSYLPMRDVCRSGFYERVDKEYHVGPLVALDVEGDDAPPPTPHTTLVLVRSPGQPDFTDHTVQVLQALHPPLRAAMRAYRAFERLRQLECAAETAYHVLPQPVLVLRADGGIEYANPAADALLVRGELLAAADGRLVRAGSCGPESVRLLVLGAMRGFAQQVAICANGDGGSTAGVLHLTRLPADPAFEARWPRGCILAAVQLRPVLGSGAKLPALTRHFGLTGAEADVLRELSCGASAKQIAEHRQVQLSTVRTQIRGLLEKTSSRRQADAVRLLLG
jgi:DNA-binding CsgD family transcriptional regulator/PAS domain-containing protein